MIFRNKKIDPRSAAKIEAEARQRAAFAISVATRKATEQARKSHGLTDREAALKTIEADLSEKTAELEKVTADLATARAAWTQIMGDANV